MGLKLVLSLRKVFGLASHSVYHRHHQPTSRANVPSGNWIDQNDEDWCPMSL